MNSTILTGLAHIDSGPHYQRRRCFRTGWFGVSRCERRTGACTWEPRICSNDEPYQEDCGWFEAQSNKTSSETKTQWCSSRNISCNKHWSFTSRIPHDQVEANNTFIPFQNFVRFHKTVFQLNCALLEKVLFWTTLFRGTLHRKLGDSTKAIDDFLLALSKINHDRESATYGQAHRQLLLTYNDIAIANFNRGRYGDAIKLLNKAIQDEKNEKGLYINRGDCFCKEGNLEFALADYQQALELDEQDDCVRSRLAVVFNEYGLQHHQDRQYQVLHLFFLFWPNQACFHLALHSWNLPVREELYHCNMATVHCLCFALAHLLSGYSSELQSISVQWFWQFCMGPQSPDKNSSKWCFVLRTQNLASHRRLTMIQRWLLTTSPDAKWDKWCK